MFHHLHTLTGRTSLRAAVSGLCTALLLLVLAPRAAHAAAPAGTPISNQASASYSDASAITRTVTSNTVVTIVQQVASLTLSANSAKTISVGGQVYYPHTLTNTGNGTDSFGLGAGNSGSFGFGAVVFYADANGDGVPDSGVPITGTGDLAAGSAFKFVAAGTVPSTAISGNTNTLTVTATSATTGSVAASNTDTTTVTGQAVIQVTQAIDVGAGLAPAGPRTITLTYTNTGNATAANLTLVDLIPSGMSYVANSARWSATGSGTVLTDANAGDNQSGIVYDFGVTAANRLTAVIASVAPGASGTLTFQLNVNAGLAPGANAATALTASSSYNDGASNVPASNTNTVNYVVTQVAAVTLGAATVASTPQGGTVSFTDSVSNTGNGSDSFDITLAASTFPAGTTFQLFQADGVTPLTDSNGNGTPDTGPLAAGASVNVVVKAVLPPGSTGGPYTVQVIATSKADASKTASATDTLTGIVASTVDLTNNSAGLGAPGLGAGPELVAASTNAANPGATTRFTLVVANNATVADSFDLRASTDATFAGLVLPSGWSVVFKDAANTLVSNTGVVAAGASKTVYADVTLLAGTAAGAVELYFRALSPTSGAADRLHDTVLVNALRSLSLTPNHSGQLAAGGTIVYSHTLTNTGTVLEGDGVVSTATLSTSGTSAGFGAVIYWDKNNNGVLDASDPVIASLSELTGGSNGASTAAGLAPGESATIFVKLAAPAGAPAGAADATTLTLTVSGVVSLAAAPAALSASDSTSVISSQVLLVKMQALDANCDGSADGAFSSATITTGAVPGACIRYQVTATNSGAANIVALVISDATPANTVYHATVAAATSAGSITAPASATAGTVQATVGALAPGQSAVMSFGVRINP